MSANSTDRHLARQRGFHTPSANCSPLRPSAFGSPVAAASAFGAPWRAGRLVRAQNRAVLRRSPPPIPS